MTDNGFGKLSMQVDDRDIDIGQDDALPSVETTMRFLALCDRPADTRCCRRAAPDSVTDWSMAVWCSCSRSACDVRVSRSARAPPPGAPAPVPGPGRSPTGTRASSRRPASGPRHATGSDAPADLSFADGDHEQPPRPGRADRPRRPRRHVCHDVRQVPSTCWPPCCLVDRSRPGRSGSSIDERRPAACRTRLHVAIICWRGSVAGEPAGRA